MVGKHDFQDSFEDSPHLNILSYLDWKLTVSKLLDSVLHQQSDFDATENSIMGQTGP